MASLSEIIDLLARAGVPYQVFNDDAKIQEVTPEYCKAIDDVMIQTGVNKYMYIQLLMRCIDQLYSALENTLDAFDDYCFELEEEEALTEYGELH